MVSFSSLAFVAVAIVLPSALAMPAATTTPYEAPRPSGVPGGAGSATYGYPPGATDYFGGGGFWGTAGAAGGEIAGTAAGGPNGPNAAAGHATGKYSDASGFVAGTANPTAQSGCAGGGYQGAGLTQCLAAPSPL